LERLGADAGLMGDVDEQAFFFDFLPTGFPSSPILFTACMFPADVQVYAYAQANGLVYSRYGDDIALSSAEYWIPQEQVEDVRAIFLQYGFDTHKIRIGHPGDRAVEICGVSIYKGGVTLSRRAVDNIRSALHHESLAEKPDFARAAGLLGHAGFIKRGTVFRLAKGKERLRKLQGKKRPLSMKALPRYETQRDFDRRWY
jgi:hypothetical protein